MSMKNNTLEVHTTPVVSMKQSGITKADYKEKYYQLRRSAKELIYENSSYQAEISECQKMVGNIFR